MNSLKCPLTVDVGSIHLLFQEYKVSEVHIELIINIMDIETKEILFSFSLRPTLHQKSWDLVGIPVFPGKENEIFDNFSELDGVDKLDARVTELFKNMVNNPEFRLRAICFVKDCIYSVKSLILKDIIVSSLPWIDPVHMHSLIDETVVEQVINE
jgi:hypothetical protein